MRLYLCRHAHAVSGSPDALRALSGAGEVQARELAQRLAAIDPRPEAVLSSPLLRARQTAEAIARALGIEVTVDDRLAPGSTPATLLAAARDSGASAVATVGHQPDCSDIASAVTGSDPGFRPAGMAALDLDG